MAVIKTSDLSTRAPAQQQHKAFQRALQTPPPKFRTHPELDQVADVVSAHTAQLDSFRLGTWPQVDIKTAQERGGQLGGGTRCLRPLSHTGTLRSGDEMVR